MALADELAQEQERQQEQELAAADAKTFESAAGAKRAQLLALHAVALPAVASNNIVATDAVPHSIRANYLPRAFAAEAEQWAL